MKKIIDALLDWDLPEWLLSLLLLLLVIGFLQMIGFWDFIDGYYQFFIDYHNNRP